MPIREESFRIGCGRYLQGAGYVDKIGEEVLRLGTSPLVIGGKTALSLTGAELERSLAGKCNKYEFAVHTGTCNEEQAKEFARLAVQKGYDVIVGVGGGVICDFAKLCAFFAKLPVVNVPTSSATCAAYTPLSVRYTPEGRTVGTLHYGYEVNAVIADTAVIAGQPVRLLLAGVFDALAKFVEIKQRFTEETEEYPMGLNYAYALAKTSYQELNNMTPKCIEDMKKGVLSREVENVIFTSIAATGVISGIARGSNQCAVAHKFYEITRTLFPDSARPYLHGEIVGIGLLLQNHFNGEEGNNTALLELMKKNNMPCRLEDIGVSKTEEAFRQYYERLCATSAIETEEESIRLKTSLNYLWRIR